MILLCGIPSEPPMAMVAAQLTDLGIPHVTLNQRDLAASALTVGIGASGLWGDVRAADGVYPLDVFTGVYTRLMDYRFVPEYEGEQPQSPLRDHFAAFHTLFTAWCEIAPIRVVNRASAMGSNFSKPYQAQIVRSFGFRVPETLVTNDPEQVREFAAASKVIYKSISGVRSIVRMLREEDLARLNRIKWCPTQFQEYVEGIDLRVHAVGERVFATLVESDATDYRYASEEGDGFPELRPYALGDDLAGRCVALTRSLGLELSGIDLRLTREGDVYCFEVNPSPAFSYYESHTGQPIARAVARRLGGID